MDAVSTCRTMCATASPERPPWRWQPEPAYGSSRFHTTDFWGGNTLRLLLKMVTYGESISGPISGDSEASKDSKGYFCRNRAKKRTLEGSLLASYRRGGKGLTIPC